MTKKASLHATSHADEQLVRMKPKNDNKLLKIYSISTIDEH